MKSQKEVNDILQKTNIKIKGEKKMKAIIGAKVIEMNKTEANAAGRVNSDAFKELSTLRAAYPDFRIVIKSVKAKDTGIDSCSK